MKKSFSLANFLSTGALLVSLVIGSGTANAQSTPPARTYHVDQYGRETKEVKERWGENSSGQKHGVYVYYAKGGTPIEMYTYVNGIKSGPAYLIRDDGFYSISFRPTMKFVGGYVNDKKQGLWTVTNVGFQGKLGDLDRNEVYVGGVRQKANTYEAGKITGSYSYSNGERNGPAKVFGGSEIEYASGSYLNGKPTGTWVNAGVQGTEIVYKKGASLTFDGGGLSLMKGSDGTVRSVKAEAQQKVEDENKAQAAKEDEEEIYSNAKIELQRIRFYSDSYMLTPSALKALDYYAKKINYRNTTNTTFGKVKKVRLSVHTELTKGGDDTERIKYILTLNRALLIKNYLASKIIDKSVTIEYMGCASQLSLPKGDFVGFDDENRMQLSVNEVMRDTDLENAREVYNKLSAKFGIVASERIIPNPVLRTSIVNAINYFCSDMYLADDALRCQRKGECEPMLGKIPVEFWVPIAQFTELGEEDPTVFKQTLINNIAKFNKSNNRTGEGAILPDPFFSRSLIDYLTEHPEKR